MVPLIHAARRMAVRGIVACAVLRMNSLKVIERPLNWLTRTATTLSGSRAPA